MSIRQPNSLSTVVVVLQINFSPRVHATNRVLRLAFTRPPDPPSFPRPAATPLLSVPHNVAFARRMVHQASPSFRISFKNRPPARAPAPVQSLQPADSPAKTA